MAAITFLGITTTGPQAPQTIWEISAIVHDNPTLKAGEYQWQINPDVAHADADRLHSLGFEGRNAFKKDKRARVGDGYTVEHSSYKPGRTAPDIIAQELGQALDGALVVGINPHGWLCAIEQFLATYGANPRAQEHVVDALALGAGYMLGKVAHTGNFLAMPQFDAVWVTELLGVERPSSPDALSQAKWAQRLYERAMGDLG